MDEMPQKPKGLTLMGVGAALFLAGSTLFSLLILIAFIVLVRACMG